MAPNDGVSAVNGSDGNGNAGDGGKVEDGTLLFFVNGEEKKKKKGITCVSRIFFSLSKPPYVNFLRTLFQPKAISAHHEFMEEKNLSG